MVLSRNRLINKFIQGSAEHPHPTTFYVKMGDVEFEVFCWAANKLYRQLPIFFRRTKFPGIGVPCQ